MQYRYKIMGLLVFFTSFITIVYGNTLQASPNFLLYDKQQLEDLQHRQEFSPLQQNIANIITKADKALLQVPVSVIEKTVDLAGGDPHDYISLAIYYWPNPNQATGLPYIVHDGRKNPERNDPALYDANRMNQMITSVNKLSLAYYLTSNEEYAAHAVTLLRVWFVNADTRMNPNLNFGQIVPGKNGGRPSGIIETVRLITLVDSLHMLEKSSCFSEEDQVSLKKWFNDYLTWLRTSNLGIKEGNTTNNHSVWYDAQVASFAHYIGKNDIAIQVIKNAKETRILQIEPDGSMPRELGRTNSISYTAYNLKGFITLARIGEEVGIDIWDYHSSDQRSIKQAIDYFIPYLIGEKQWTREQITPFQDPDLASYLYLAKVHYNTNAYDEAIARLLNNRK